MGERDVKTGDIVLYTFNSGNQLGQQRPAIVTKVFSSAPLNMCNLAVIPDGWDMAFAEREQITFAGSITEGEGMGHWVFP